MSDNDESLWIPWVPGKVLDLGDGIVVGLVEVTPKVAKNWLKYNRRNRLKSAATENRYERDMAGNRWPFTGDPVRFSDKLEMLDGQHRCKAIEKSGTTQTLLVVTGLPTKTQAYMDAGRKRNAGQSLSIDETPHSTAVASLVRLALRWNPSRIWVPERGTELFGEFQVSDAEILEFVENHPEVHEAARQGTAVAHEVAGARASVIGAAFLRASMLEEGVFSAAGWFMRLRTGAGLELGNPVLALRNGMMRTRAEKLANPQIPQLWKIVRAWNASRADEEMNRVQLSSAMSNGNFPDMK